RTSVSFGGPQVWRRLNQPFAARGIGFFPALEHPQPALTAVAGQPRAFALVGVLLDGGVHWQQRTQLAALQPEVQAFKADRMTYDVGEDDGVLGGPQLRPPI